MALVLKYVYEEFLSSQIKHWREYWKGIEMFSFCCLFHKTTEMVDVTLATR